MRRLLAAVLLWLLTAVGAQAHEVRPALLQITEHAPGRYDVLWKQPMVGDMTLRLSPRLSSGALDRAPDTERPVEGFLLRTWKISGGEPLEGQTVTIQGLDLTVTDVLLRVTTADGETVSSVIRPGRPTQAIGPPAGAAVPAYLRLGVEHILGGVDHLLFVAGLLLLIGPRWGLVKAITAFTVAHSITLAAAALGYVRFPSAIIEALVALSILFLACELVRPADPPTLTRRHPWLIAFGFGLLHGFAFAGALSEIGLPAEASPQALLLFNVGVELGQLAFIAGVLVLWRLWRMAKVRVPVPQALAPYAIGGLSAYWLIDRTLLAIG